MIQSNDEYLKKAFADYRDPASALRCTTSPSDYIEAQPASKQPDAVVALQDDASAEQLAENIIFELDPGFTDEFVSNLHNDILTAIQTATAQKDEWIQELSQWKEDAQASCRRRQCDKVEKLLKFEQGETTELIRKNTELETKLDMMDSALTYLKAQWDKKDGSLITHYSIQKKIETALSTLQATTHDVAAYKSELRRQVVEECIEVIRGNVRMREGQREIIGFLQPLIQQEAKEDGK